MIRDFERLKPLHERMKQLTEAETLALTEALETERQRLLRKCARLWADTPTLASDYEQFLSDLAHHARA